MPYIRVKGIPVAKGRPRATKSGVIYTPKKTADWERLVKASVSSHLGTFCSEGPLAVSLTFHMPMPKSLHKTVRDCVRLGQGTAYHSVRPDADNLAKAILDACNGLLWKDDAQVAELSVRKVYGVEPGVEISVQSL